MSASESYKKFYQYNIEKEYRFLGYFIQESGKIIVSDPSHIYDPYHSKTPNVINQFLVINKVMRGKWNVWSRYLSNDDDDWDDYDKSVCELTAICCPDSLVEGYGERRYHFFHNEWEDYASVCVHSAQVGIYDLKYYRDDNNLGNSKIWDEYNIQAAGDKWCAANCYVSKKNHAGIIYNGCVAKPCYGNKTYDVELLKFEGKIVGIRMIFDMDDSSDSDSDE